MTRRSRCSARDKQRGAVLFVSLVIMLILSMVAITLANTSIMERKMATGMRDGELARTAATSAMNEAKVRIADVGGARGGAQVCGALVCLVRLPGMPDNPDDLLKTDAARARLNSHRFDFVGLAGADASARLALPPVYLVEDLGETVPAPGPGVVGERAFRVTAQGTGAAETSRFVLQQIVTLREPLP